MCDNPTHHATISELLAMLSALQETAKRSAAVEQARGIVMAATGVDAEEAFAVLVSQSQYQYRNLWAIAEDIVEDTHNETALAMFEAQRSLRSAST